MSCQEQVTKKIHSEPSASFSVHGRAITSEDGTIALIGPASFAEILVYGDSAFVQVQSSEDYDYISLVADNEHLGRFKIDSASSSMLPIKFKDTARAKHALKIYRATEANTGNIFIKGIKADSVSRPADSPEKFAIEFIGNSITCGAAMDDSLMPCGAENYKNYHNAYLSYGPTVARELDVDFVISSVSGFGMYRGWNTEADEAVNSIPEVYNNIYLDGDGQKTRDFSSFVPDVISISLGTNDISEGDGVKKRLPFDKVKFVDSYIAFVDNLFQYYPKAKIALLNSPMVSGEENDMLMDCLSQVMNHFKMGTSKNRVALFTYSRTFQNGCNTHPNIENHSKMAAELAPFYSKLLSEN